MLWNGQAREERRFRLRREPDGCASPSIDIHLCPWYFEKMFSPDIDFAQSVRLLTASLVPMLLGMIVHEVAHGLAARRLGDPTADMMGRLTLNPVPHIDPLGLFCFVITSIAGGFIFGWARPVPVNTRYFRKPARDMMLVGLAGPGSNFLLALLFGLGLAGLVAVWPEAFAAWMTPAQPTATQQFLVLMCTQGILINLCLAWFNLLPLPPLDGSRVVTYFLPMHLAISYARLGNYGFVVLLVLLFTGVLGRVLGPLVDFSFKLILRLTLSLVA